MARKTRKQKEQEAKETMEGLMMLWKLFTDEKYTKAFIADVETVGKFSAETILALQGRADPVDQILGKFPLDAEEEELAMFADTSPHLDQPDEDFN